MSYIVDYGVKNVSLRPLASKVYFLRLENVSFMSYFPIYVDI